MSSSRSSSSKSRQHRSGLKSGRGKGGGSLTNELQALMEGCPNAESLNAEVIMPFVQALVTVCDARGYVFNIYGDHCNLTITPEDHAEPLYRLIDSYLDEAGLG